MVKKHTADLQKWQNRRIFNICISIYMLVKNNAALYYHYFLFACIFYVGFFSRSKLRYFKLFHFARRDNSSSSSKNCQSVTLEINIEYQRSLLFIHNMQDNLEGKYLKHFDNTIPLKILDTKARSTPDRGRS